MSYLYRMDVPQNLGPTEKNSQMAPAVWKIENNYYTKNISTMHSLTGAGCQGYPGIRNGP